MGGDGEVVVACEVGKAGSKMECKTTWSELRLGRWPCDVMSASRAVSKAGHSARREPTPSRSCFAAGETQRCAFALIRGPCQQFGEVSGGRVPLKIPRSSPLSIHQHPTSMQLSP